MIRATILLLIATTITTQNVTPNSPFCQQKCQGQISVVCGRWGNVLATYASKCSADCNGVSVEYQGACLTTTPSPIPPIVTNPNPTDPNYQPPINTPINCVGCETTENTVCGADGINYRNPCMAQCRGIAVKYAGRCFDCSQPCPTYFNFVCGSDRVTYENECKMRCVSNSGASIASYGRCV